MLFTFPLEKALVREHSNVSCQAALWCFTVCFYGFCTLKFNDFSQFWLSTIGSEGGNYSQIKMFFLKLKSNCNCNNKLEWSCPKL